MTAFDISAFRMVLETETDTDANVNKELMDQFRENIEALVLLTFSTGTTGSATSNPPNDTTGVLTDTAASYDADEHNNRVLLMTSGLAKGTMYQIDDTTATTIICTGDNLYADGVRSGDTYHVLYNVKNTGGGHTHDGEDSALSKPARGRTTVVSDGELITETGPTSSYTVHRTYGIYIPVDQTTLSIGFLGQRNGDGTPVAKFTITDSASSSLNVEVSGINPYSYTYQTTSINCSTLAAGWGYVTLEMKYPIYAKAFDLKGLSMHWNL